MGVTTYSEERESPVSPVRLFKALITEAHESLPKLLPQSVKAVEFDSAGRTKKTVFTEGSPLKYLKHRVDAVDKQNFSCKYTLIEGDILELDKNLEFISYSVKFEPSRNGGSVIKSISEFHTKGDTKLKEEHIKAGKENAVVLSQLVEDYLVKNPTAYA